MHHIFFCHGFNSFFEEYAEPSHGTPRPRSSIPPRDPPAAAETTARIPSAAASRPPPAAWPPCVHQTSPARAASHASYVAKQPPGLPSRIAPEGTRWPVLTPPGLPKSANPPSQAPPWIHPPATECSHDEICTPPPSQSIPTHATADAPTLPSEPHTVSSSILHDPRGHPWPHTPEDRPSSIIPRNFNDDAALVVSSQAQRLKPHAIDVRAPIDPIHWFLDPKGDVRSSYYLED